ncbi:hypothetical protein OF83DRAFT_1261700 [Amylostereum chailletii]|nr:hypothetical protein OF83DRAFT_1261700 [Amylostereum chailletii]
MSNFNPLVQGWGRTSSAPSLFGALPGGIPSNSRAPPLANAVTFRFTNFHPNILNSTVLNPQGKSQFRVVTEAVPGRPTVWLDAHQRTIALLEWSSQPVVEIPGLLPRTALKNWLRTSSTQTARYMDVRGVQYIWAPVEHDICLYHNQSGQSTMLARICNISNGAVLEMTPAAIQYGLLEVCAVATTIFLCGVNFD